MHLADSVSPHSMKGMSESTISTLFWVIFGVAAVLVLLAFLQFYGAKLFPIKVA